MANASRIDDVFEAAQKVLQTVRNISNEVGHELPDREYIIAGTTAHDCEQLTVSFVGLNEGLPDQQTRPNCVDPKTVVFLIDIVRELPQGTGRSASSPIVPTPEKIMETAYIQLRDSKLLADACDEIIKSNFIPVGTYSIIVGEPGGRRQAVSAELRIPL